MEISIIIPTYNSLPKLKKSLESVNSICFNKSSFEVLVVDDGSTDETPIFLENFKKETDLNFRFWIQPNRGPAAARNLAIKNSRGVYLLSIDSDCYVNRNIIQEYLKYFPCEGLAGVGGNVIPEEENYISRYLDDIGVWRPGCTGGEISYLVTANAFFCKKVLIDIGGFDEEFRYPGGEDPEMCYRILRKGYYFQFEKNAKVIHSHRTSLKGMIKMFITHGVGRKIIDRKWKEKKITKKSLLKDILGINIVIKISKNFKSFCRIRAISYVALDYIRILSYYYGYFMKI